MSQFVRIRTAVGNVLVGTIENESEHQFELLRVANEDRGGSCHEYDPPFRMRMAKAQVISLVVAAATDGRNVMVDQDGLLAAHHAAMRLRTDTWSPPIEISACPIEPVDFAEALCEMEGAA